MEVPEFAELGAGNLPVSLGKYVPFARIGDGGMADVFLAVARGPMGFQKLTVLKKLRSPDDAHVQMFLDEARLSARLNHPNIVQTHDVGDEQGGLFIAMDYLEGLPLHTLRTRIARAQGELPAALSAYIVAQALKGLHYAHELTDYDGVPLGIVHRDISPHNLFATYNGEVKLLDFGIAKALGNSSQTQTGVLKGKLKYMSPEQAACEEVDRRSDLFAIGIVLWEMLAGRRLFEGETVRVINSVLNNDAPLLSSIKKDIDPELERIVAKALQRSRDARYQTAEQMRLELEAFLRKQPEDVSDAALARLMNDNFGATRDAVRQSIRAFLGKLPKNSADSERGAGGRLIENLPSISSSAGDVPPAEGGISNERTPTVPQFAGRSRVRRWAPVAFTIAVFAILGLVALRGKQHAPSTVPAVLVQPARVHVDSNPNGALIQRNGTTLGVTPAELTLDEGTHTLNVLRDGYAPQTLRVEARPGTVSRQTLSLEPVPAATAAAQPSMDPAVLSEPAARARARTAPQVRPRPQPLPSAAPLASQKPKSKFRVLVDENEGP
jgi:serine/threonine-protein kinase